MIYSGDFQLNYLKFNGQSPYRVYAGDKVVMPFGNLVNVPNGTGGFLGYASNSRYYNVCLAPNNKLYYPPRDGTNIIEYDPQTKEFFTIFPTNPDTGEFTTFTNNTLFPTSAWGRYVDVVLAQNGNLYMMPYGTFGERAIVEINPNTREISAFGNTSIPAGSFKWFGAALAHTGTIYVAPCSQNRFLKFNPITKAVSYVNLPTNPNIGGDPKFFGLCHGPNNKLYTIPGSARCVLEIDPETDEITVFGESELSVSFPRFAYRFVGGVLHPATGLIYCMPYYSDKIGVIDPINKTFRFFSGPAIPPSFLFNGWFPTAGCTGGKLAPNGRIYGIPAEATLGGYILEIDPIAETFELIRDTKIVGSNMYASSALHPNGFIYYGMQREGRLYELKTGWKVDPTDPVHNIPTDISTLHTSLYNRYHNIF